MSVPALLRHPVTLYMLGCLLLIFSTFLLVEHAVSVQQFTTLTFPIAAEIPPLERRLRVLEDQVRTAELQAAVLLETEEEMVRVFVFPSDAGITGLVKFFDFLRDDLLEKKLLLEMSSITVGEASKVPDMPHLRRVPLSLTFRLQQRGVEQVLWLIDHAGAVTIADILSPEEIDLLLAKAEEENPSSIVALELFLSTDILQYVREPKPLEEQIRRSFVSDGFHSTFESVRDGSLATARSFLGGRFGTVLEREHLWPLRAMRIVRSDVRMEEDIRNLSLEIEAYARAEH